MPPTVILVRHAQALHNVDNKLLQLPTNYTLHDPELSELGRKQCAELKSKLVPRIPKDFDVGLIIVSPMKRTIETALLAFGDLVQRGVPIVAHAGWQALRHRLPLLSLPALFPQVDFSQVDPRYPDKTSPAASAIYGYSRQAIVGRGQSVLAELHARPEKAVLVVSHSGFLRVGVTGHFFMNADYRIFDFVEPQPQAKAGAQGGGGRILLSQWAETRSGGMGWSWEETVPLGDGLPDVQEAVESAECQAADVV